ncbi:hypothetical protein [Acidimangrovimonas pyrenivorans]|uniref:J domain-containing protein n=1 Tax=Acidimangrovimonas pyrenivorans TaxID=2030798 RepID=A0ABV7ACT1_9RHOB
MTPDVSDPSIYQMFASGYFLLLLFWFINPAGVEAILTLIFYLLAGIVLALGFLLSLLRTLLRYAWRGNRRFMPSLGRLALLLGFVILEAFRRTPPEPEFEDPEPDFDAEYDPDPEPEPGPRPTPKPVDKIGWALAVLGLTRDELTPEALKRAYRTAIKAAHPDLTGSTEEAVRINQARDAIRQHFNWS